MGCSDVLTPPIDRVKASCIVNFGILFGVFGPQKLANIPNPQFLYETQMAEFMWKSSFFICFLAVMHKLH